jgi:diketogulonate reductase-like aldo/keto reductase
MNLTAGTRTVTLPSGRRIAALGQGTWHMAEDPRRRADEIAALRLGIDLGMTLIDTAEMYADGGSEELVGEAISGRRDGLFLVSKVLPNHASRRGAIAACEGSLRRLGVDQIDLYLLHWRGNIPLQETLDAFEALVAAGKIGSWGVSNFDADDMDELFAAGGAECATNQILYNLLRRGAEFDLLPEMAKRKIPAMAYSPIEQGRLPGAGALLDIAKRHRATTFQIALAWLLRKPDIIVIPKAATIEHVSANRAALDIALDKADLAALDQAFAPPRRKTPLAML